MSLIDPKLTFSWRMAVLIALVGIAMHVFALHALKSRTPRLQKINDFATMGDGYSYVTVGQQLAGGPEAARYDRRVFLGVPLIIAGAIRVGLEPQIFSLILCSVAWVAFLIALSHLLGDYCYGIVAAVFPPTLVLDTSLVGTEQVMLLLETGAFLLAARGRTSGILFAAALIAYATLVRPAAIFAGGGLLIGLYQLFGLKRGLTFAVALALMTLGIHAVVTHYYWSIFESSRIYQTEQGAYGSAGHLFTYPYGSFVMAVQNGELAQRAFLFKLTFCVAGLACIILLVRRTILRPSPLNLAIGAWGVCGYVFVICIGSFWGARIHPRALSWTLPCLIAPVIPLFPRRGFGLIAVGMAAFSLIYVYLAPYSS